MVYIKSAQMIQNYVAVYDTSTHQIGEWKPLKMKETDIIITSGYIPIQVQLAHT
jgi:hypothetical protein